MHCIKLIYNDYSENNIRRTNTGTIREKGYPDLVEKPYLKAFTIGWVLCIFQGLTGINWIIFYSTDIFSMNKTGSHAEVSAKFGTFLFGLVNWLSCILAVFILSYVGRKTMMLQIKNCK